MIFCPLTWLFKLSVLFLGFMSYSLSPPWPSSLTGWSKHSYRARMMSQHIHLIFLWMLSKQLDEDDLKWAPRVCPHIGFAICCSPYLHPANINKGEESRIFFFYIFHCNYVAIQSIRVWKNNWCFLTGGVWIFIFTSARSSEYTLP